MLSVLRCNMQEIKGFSFLKQSRQVERKRFKYKDRKDGRGKDRLDEEQRTDCWNPVEYALFWVFVCCPLWKVALHGIPCCLTSPSLRYKPCLSKSLNPCTPPYRCFFRTTDAVVQTHTIHAGSTDLISHSHKLPFTW